MDNGHPVADRMSGMDHRTPIGALAFAAGIGAVLAVDFVLDGSDPSSAALLAFGALPVVALALAGVLRKKPAAA